MEYLAALATIVQLIGMYRQEKGQRDDLTHREFMEWLEYHRHEDLKRLISDTHHASKHVDQLLQEGQQAVLSKLNDINSIVADVLRHVESFRAITTALVPDCGISEDAVFILQLFAQSNGSSLSVDCNNSGEIFIDDIRQTTRIENLRFLQADMNSLVHHGFLAEVPGTSLRRFNLNRVGATFAKLSQSGTIKVPADDTHTLKIDHQ